MYPMRWVHPVPGRERLSAIKINLKNMSPRQSDAFILILVAVLSITWSLWVFANFPSQEEVITHTGFIQCFRDDGVGPLTSDCAEIEVKCYTEKGGDLVLCPFFENLN